MDDVELPTPTMLSVIVALGLAEIEEEHPGFIDRLIGRLSGAALREQVIQIRGKRALPAVMVAQEQALLWLTAIKPLVATERRKKRRL